MTTHTPAQLTAEDKKILANRIYRLIAELNRAIVDAAENKIQTFLTAVPDQSNPVMPRMTLQARIYEHVDFPDPATLTGTTPPDPSNEATK